MFLARIDGTVVPAAKHATLEGCRFLIALRLEADGSTGAEPLVVIDWMGAARGSTVLVSTDGDIARDDFIKDAHRETIARVIRAFLHQNIFPTRCGCVLTNHPGNWPAAAGERSRESGG